MKKKFMSPVNNTIDPLKSTEMHFSMKKKKKKAWIAGRGLHYSLEFHLWKCQTLKRKNRNAIQTGINQSTTSLFFQILI